MKKLLLILITSPSIILANPVTIVQPIPINVVTIEAEPITCIGAVVVPGSKANAGSLITPNKNAIIIITFPKAAPTAWVVMASDNTTPTLIRQIASTKTTATLSGNTAIGDVITYIAFTY